MKKILVTSLFFLMLVGCSKIGNEEAMYYEYSKTLKNVQESSEYLPFSIDIEIEKLSEKEYIYVVSIDNPKKELKNIEAIATHNYETEDVFPSSGIFDQKLNLIPNVIDENNNIVKGILLIGYIDSEEIEKTKFKILVKANNKNYFYIKNFESL